MKTVLAAALGVAMSAGAADAAAVFAFVETGTGVEGTLTGELDPGTPLPTGLDFSAGIEPQLGLISTSDGLVPVLEPYAIDGPLSFGSGVFTSGVATGLELSLALAIVTLGDGSQVGPPLLLLPQGFSAGPVQATLNLPGNFDSLGVTPGSYVYTLATDDTLTLRFGPEEAGVIPLPAGLPLLAGALGLFGLARRRF
jgi:hypothetical protein